MATQLKLIDLERTYTAEEFEQLPDDGNRYELIDGRLREMPPAGDRHGRIGKRLAKAFLAHDPEETQGMVWFNTGFVLDALNTPEPDLMYIVTERCPVEADKALPVIPDLVVEVWSPSQLTATGIDKESMEKIRKYQKVGVKIIWSIIPARKTVSVYYPDKLEPVKVLTIGDNLDGETVIPGLKIDLSKIFDPVS
jgi:Uma2 family endonuclease